MCGLGMEENYKKFKKEKSDVKQGPREKMGMLRVR